MFKMRLAVCLLGAALVFPFATPPRSRAQAPAEDLNAIKLYYLDPKFMELIGAAKFAEARSVGRKLIEEIKLRFGGQSREYAAALLSFSAITLTIPPNEADMANILMALKMYEEHLGPEDPTVANILLYLATTYQLTKSRPGDHVGKSHEAQPPLERAVKILEKNPGPDSVAYADGLVAPSNFYRESRQLTKRANLEQPLRRALTIYEESLGINSGKAMSLRSTLIGLPGEFKQHEQTLRGLREFAARQEATLGLDHRETMIAISQLTSYLRDQCRDEEAEVVEKRLLPRRAEELQRAVERAEIKDGPKSSRVIFNLNELGGVYVRLDRVSDARRAFGRVIEALQEVRSDGSVAPPAPRSNESFAYATARGGIARIDLLERRLEEAEKGFVYAIATFDEREEGGRQSRYVPVQWLDGLEMLYKAQQSEADAAAIRARASRRQAERACPS